MCSFFPILLSFPVYLNWLGHAGRFPSQRKGFVTERYFEHILHIWQKQREPLTKKFAIIIIINDNNNKNKNLEGQAYYWFYENEWYEIIWKIKPPSCFQATIFKDITLYTHFFIAVWLKAMTWVTEKKMVCTHMGRTHGRKSCTPVFRR